MGMAYNNLIEIIWYVLFVTFWTRRLCRRLIQMSIQQYRSSIAIHSRSAIFIIGTSKVFLRWYSYQTSRALDQKSCRWFRHVISFSRWIVNILSLLDNTVYFLHDNPVTFNTGLSHRSNRLDLFHRFGIIVAHRFTRRRRIVKCRMQ